MSANASIATVRGAKVGKIFPPDHAWLGLQAEEPVLEPDLPIIDTHHHLWDRPGNRYLVPDLIQDLATGHNVIATVSSECDAMYRTTGPEEMKPVGETEFIVRSVENLSASAPAVAAGIVGFAKVTLGDAVEPVLEAHIEAGKGRFRGIRYTTTWDASESIASRGVPHVLARPDFRAGIGRLSKLGLVFDAWVFHHQLGELADLARAFPDATIVVCHCGGLLGYGPYAADRDGGFQHWRQELAGLAHCPNVYMKLGGLLMRLAAFDYTTVAKPPSSQELAAMWTPSIETCIELFGAQRCMFESNYPVEKMGTGYAVLWNAFKRITAGATAAEKGALYKDVAAKVYRLEGL